MTGTPRGVGWGQDSPSWCFSSPELCKKYTPANFSRYYYPHEVQNSLLCISNCTLNVPGSFNCDSGFCRVTLEGPQCL